MSSPKQSSRRIVSKGEYAKAQTKRTATSVMGMMYVVMGVLFGTAAITLVLALVYHYSFPTRDFLLNAYVPIDRQKDPVNAFMGTVLFNSFFLSMFGGLAYSLSQFGFEILKEAASLDPGIPLTRANTADLPAPDSLVRASEEPMQPQQAVLLRAVTPNIEAHEEQLLRASLGRDTSA